MTESHSTGVDDATIVRDSCKDPFPAILFKATASVNGFYEPFLGDFPGAYLCKAMEFSYSSMVLLGREEFREKALMAREKAFEVFAFESSGKDPFEDPEVQGLLSGNITDTNGGLGAEAAAVPLFMALATKLIASPPNSVFLLSLNAAVISAFGFHCKNVAMSANKGAVAAAIAMVVAACFDVRVSLYLARTWSGASDFESFTKWVSGYEGSQQVQYFNAVRLKNLTFGDGRYGQKFLKTLDLRMIGAEGTSSSQGWRDAADLWMGTKSAPIRNAFRVWNETSRIELIDAFDRLRHDETKVWISAASCVLVWVLCHAFHHAFHSGFSEEETEVSLKEMKTRPGTAEYIPLKVESDLMEVVNRDANTQAKYKAWQKEEFEARGRGQGATEMWKLDELEKRVEKLQNTSTKGNTFRGLRRDLDNLVRNYLMRSRERPFLVKFSEESEFQREFNKMYAWMIFLAEDFSDFVINQNLGGAADPTVPPRRTDKSPPRLRPSESSMVDIVFARHGL